MKKALWILAMIGALTAGKAAAEIHIKPDVTCDKGLVTVYWEDGDAAPPYTVSYQCAEDTLDRQCLFIQEDVAGASCGLRYLAPGTAYRITVENAAGDQDETEIRVPEAAVFADGKLEARHLRVHAEPRKKRRSEERIREIKRFEAEEMVSALADTGFGVAFSLSYPALSHGRKYETQVALQAPGGFLCVYSLGEVAYESPGNTGVQLQWSYLGEEFFDYLYAVCGAIPAGKYTLTCYLDGMYAAETSFRVE